MQKIIPHIWYDKEAKEAAQFYTSIFPDSEITHTTTLHNTPSGDSDIVRFRLMDYTFMAISAGPYFKLNPAISFMVNFDPGKDEKAREKLDEMWGKLMEGGKALMELDEYPFSKRYGWVQDKYGLSWQLILTNPSGEDRPNIIPSLLFVGDVCGKTEEASDFYISIFNDSKRGEIAHYPKGMEPDREGTVMFTDFTLEGQWFAAMDSAHEHKFAFTEAVSLLVNCRDQQEINYLWERLSAVPESEQCGWLKDKFGVSWQIAPVEMNEMMEKATPEQLDRITKAFMPMKKLNLAEIKAAYEGK